MNQNYPNPKVNPPDPKNERGSIVKSLLLVLALLAVSASLTYAMIVTKTFNPAAAQPSSAPKPGDNESEHKIILSQNPIYLGDAVTITVTHRGKEKDSDFSILVDGSKVIDGPTGVYTATSAGTHTITAKDDKNLLPYTTNLTVVSVTLNAVKFSGGNHPVCSDADGSAYPDTQWTTTANYPICYTRKTKMTVQPQFTLVPTTFAGPALVKGICSGPKLPLAHTLSDPTIESKRKFENKVSILNKMTIDWQCSLDNGKTWHDIATSANQVYVTLNDPTCDKLYHTVVDVACRNALGKRNKQEIFDGIWKDFAGKQVLKFDRSTKLLYWGSLSEANKNDKKWGDIEELMKYGDAKCGGWSRFFRSVLAVHDIQSVSYTIKPIRPYDVMRINSSLPAQGGTPLHFDFNDHAVDGYGGKLYDVSYGIEYGSGHDYLQSWEDASLEFVAKPPHRVPDDCQYHTMGDHQTTLKPNK